VPELCILLKDDSVYVRRGAALGLGYMGARDKAGDVARLLEDDEDQVCGAAAEALAEMDAGDWAQQTAGLLQNRAGEFSPETACYALVRLRANGQAARIAALLDDKYKKGDAAKALALLGEIRYAGNIARLLKSEDFLDRDDACLALGILGIKAYEKDLAEMLKNENGTLLRFAAGLWPFFRTDLAFPASVPSAVDEVRSRHKLCNGSIVERPVP